MDFNMADIGILLSDEEPYSQTLVCTIRQ